jgi:hypothetical protein
MFERNEASYRAERLLLIGRYARSRPAALPGPRFDHFHKCPKIHAPFDRLVGIRLFYSHLQRGPEFEQSNLHSLLAFANVREVCEVRGTLAGAQNSLKILDFSFPVPLAVRSMLVRTRYGDKNTRENKQDPPPAARSS